MTPHTNPIVLVTGAGRGVGRALAEAFAAAGYAVAANDLSPMPLDETLERIRTRGGRAKEYLFDTAKRLPVISLVQQVLDDWGRIDVLVNAAEAAPAEPLLKLDEWDFHRALDVNLAGAFLLMQVVEPIMQAQGGGVIINMGSGLQVANSAVYTASKAALAALSRAAAQEFAVDGVRVIFAEAEPDEGMEQMAARLVHKT